MSEVSKNSATSPDDIDLLLLLERCLLFFRKYKWLFIIAVVLGLLAGIYMYRSLPSIYRSRMVVHSFLLTNQEDIQLVDNWNNLLKRNEYEELTSVLNCDEKILGKLKQLKAEEIQKVFNNNNNPHGFIIDVSVTDNAILDDLQKAIVYGFENSEYVKEKLATRKAMLEELIGKTGTEVQKLDSIKRSIENLIEGKGTISSSLIVDGAGVNRQLIEMNEKYLAYKSELKFNNAVQVLQSFKKFRKPTDPKLFSWLIIGVMVFLSLAFLYSVYHSIHGKLKNRLQSVNKQIRQ